MAGFVGWTTDLARDCGGVSNMRTSICRITAEGWMRHGDWGGGLTATIRSGRTRRWVMQLRRQCTLIPAHTAPSRRHGKRWSDREARAIATLDRKAGGSKRLEIRPPAAVRFGTLRNRRGRTGSATHSSFSLFERVSRRRLNDRQTKIQMTAGHKSPSYFLRSVV